MMSHVQYCKKTEDEDDENQREVVERLEIYLRWNIHPSRPRETALLHSRHLIGLKDRLRVRLNIAVSLAPISESNNGSIRV